MKSKELWYIQTCELLGLQCKRYKLVFVSGKTHQLLEPNKVWSWELLLPYSCFSTPWAKLTEGCFQNIKSQACYYTVLDSKNSILQNIHHQNTRRNFFMGHKNNMNRREVLMSHVRKLFNPYDRFAKEIQGFRIPCSRADEIIG